MKRKIAYISIFFVIAIIMLSCSAYASNVLIISEEDVVHGSTVGTMLDRIAPDEYNIEEISIEEGKSLAQVVGGIDATGKTYDSVIIQLPFDNKESVADITSAINTLYTKFGSTENTQYFLGTPTGSITEYDKNIVTAKENVKNIMTGMTAKKVASIPVYENLKKAQDNSLEMYSNGKITPLGNLLVACTYCNSLGKKVEGLSSYEGLVDSEVVKVVGIANETGMPVADEPTKETVAEEPPKEPEEKIDEDTDVTEVVGSAVVGINREPIVEMVTSDPTGLKIRIYDKEKAGIKTASLTINDANGEKIEPDSVEGEKVKSYVYVIKKELLNTEEYKQFYIYAEDNDGCILREYFRVKYSETANNGSNYKVNRAPRIRPKLFTDSELETVNNISLYVMDQTGVQRVTPKTVEENGLKEVNLYADGKYNGYDGIEENYEWRDVKGKTTTSSKTYVKEAYTQFQNINEFFKYENSESKVSLLVGDNKYRFNAHAVDATGLATDKIMIIDFSNGKNEITEDENEYNLTVDPNGGTINGYEKPATPVIKLRNNTGYWNNVSSFVAARQKYIFTGWYDDPEGGILVYNIDGTAVNGTKYWKDANNYIGGADLTIYAHWTYDSASENEDWYTLILDPNGGLINGEEGPISPEIKLKNNTGYWNNVSSFVATRQNYTFAGWYDAPEGGILVYNVDGTEVDGTKYWKDADNYIGGDDLTVYAHWSSENTNTNNTANNVNTTNNTNNTNTTSTNTNNTNKTSSKASDQGILKASDATPAYVAYKGNREPRLKYFGQPDYLYIELRDCGGIACEFPSMDGKRKIEAQKSLQPKIYHYDNDKRGAEIKVKRPKEADYKKNGKEYVYRIGLPASEIGEEYKKFEIVAYDVIKTKKQQFYIDEIFMAKKSKDGKITVNRAPTSYLVGLRADMSQMGILANDGTGISTIRLETNPKTKGGKTDNIRGRSGSNQEHWSAITYITYNRKYVRAGITKFEKINTIFKNRNWKGLNPRVAGEDGVFSLAIVAADASGASSRKTLKIDTKYYYSGDAYTPTGNGKVKTLSKKASTKKSSKKSSSKKSSSKKSSSKKSSSKKSSSKKSSSKKATLKANKGNGSGSGSNNSNSSLKRGSKGEEVKKLQKRLNELGYGLTVDGDFGANTENAVKDFQKNNDLSVDGVVGPKTWAKLNSSGAIGKGPYSKDPNSGSNDPKEPNNPTGGKGSSKENAIVDDKKFVLMIDTSETAGHNAYMPMGNIDEGPFTVVSKQGKLTDYKIEQGHGIKISKEPTRTQSDYGRDMLRVYTQLDHSTKGETVSSSYGDVHDSYITVIGYYNDGGTWYTSKCRMHYLLATDRWWSGAGWKNLSTNVPN